MHPTPRGYITGDVLDFVQRTTSLTVASTTEATPTDWITGTTAFLLEYAQLVCVEFWSPTVDATANGAGMGINVWDSLNGAAATNLGYAFNIRHATATNENKTCIGKVFPSLAAGRHIISLKAWKFGTAATQTIYAGVGGAAGVYQPAWMRVTKA